MTTQTATPKGSFAPFELNADEVQVVVTSRQQWEQVQSDFKNTHRDHGDSLGLARQLGFSCKGLPLFRSKYPEGYDGQTLRDFIEENSATLAH